MTAYDKFIAQNPTRLTSVSNSKGQLIELYEHPVHGDEASIVAVCKAVKGIVSTGFYDTDDFHAGSDYNPVFDSNGKHLGSEYEL